MEKSIFKQLLDKIANQSEQVKNCRLASDITLARANRSYEFEFKGLQMEIRNDSFFDEEYESLRESISVLVFPSNVDATNKYIDASSFSSERLSIKPYEYNYDDENEYKQLENIFNLVKGKAHGTESAVLKALED